MKMVVALFAVLMVACSSEYDMRIPVGDDGKLSESSDDAAEFKAAVEKLPKADQESVAAYLIRSAMAAAMTGMPMQPVTVREAIAAQKKFEADQKAEADKADAERAKQAALEKAERDAHEAKLKAFRDKVRGALLDKLYRPADYRNGIVQDGLFFKVAFTNKTDKKIVGMKGSLELSNTLGDRISGLNITIEDDIPAGETYMWQGGFNFNEFMADHVALRDSDTAKVVSQWQPEVLMFEDGTVERME